jgi:DNA-binding NarL/FixJ family response regulator
MTLSVLIADKHPVVREGLRSWLAEPDFEVVAEESSASGAVDAALRHRPDAVVLDPAIDGGTAGALCTELHERLPETAIVVYAADLDEETVVSAAAAGARAYLLKSAPKPDLPDVLRRVAAGERIVDPSVAETLFRAQGRAAKPRLTDQELSVIRLAARGFTNREIGAHLYLSRHTVKEYLSHAMRKLEVDGRVAAVVEAGRRGLLEPTPLQKAS